MAGRQAVAALALAAGLVAGEAGATKTVRGTLVGGEGWVITGATASGEGVSRRLGADGRFALAFPGRSARGASLQLVGPNGHYFGPVVLRQAPGKAFIVLSGKSVNLGRVALHDGFAAPMHPAPKRAVVAARVARADDQGRPAGAGRLGVVAAPGGPVRALDGQPGAGPGEDLDGDGIVNAFDADDDGDLVLDNVDADNSHESGGIFSTLYVDLAQSLNANVGTVTRAAIDALVLQAQNLVFFFDDAQLGGATVLSADVDCFTLPYCARGTGSAMLTGLSESSPTLPTGRPWIEYDPNGDGLPNLEPIASFSGGPVHAASIRPLVTTAQIAAGDAFDVVFTTPAGAVRLPRSVPPYFVTSPAVVAYDAGGGPQAISYPVAPGTPGTGGNPIAMTSELLALTFYRPQRPAIAGAEDGEWIDMGHLHYGIPLDAGGHEVACAGDYSALSPTLADTSAAGPDFAFQLFPLTDGAADAPPSGDRTLAFTIDLGSCLRRAGVDPTGMTLQLGVTATGESRPGGVDRAAQMLTVRMP